MNTRLLLLGFLIGATIIFLTALIVIPVNSLQSAAEAMIVDLPVGDEISWQQNPFDIRNGFVLTMTLAPDSMGTRRFSFCHISGTTDIVWNIASEVSWFDASPKSGVVAPGECDPITGTFDSTGLSEGVYTFTLVITSNAHNSPHLLPVELTVKDWVQVEVRFRAFIPCSAVSLQFIVPLSLFGGDGYSHLTQRALQSVVVTMDPDKNPAVTTPARSWGQSSRYNNTQGQHVSGQPGWCWEFLPGEQGNPVAVATLQVLDSNNRVQIQRLSQEELKVTLTLAGNNPVSPISTPDLDAKIEVFIYQKEGQDAQYKVDGWHDGFPAYALYLDGFRVHCYDPLLQGKSPWALLPGLDERASTGNWQKLPTVENCSFPRGLRTNYPIGQPGSILTLTGSGLEANESFQILINGTAMGTVSADGDGRFQVGLDTSNAALGIYVVSASSNLSHQASEQHLSTVSTIFTLMEDAPLPQLEDGVTVIIAVPPDIALTVKAYLPVVSR